MEGGGGCYSVSECIRFAVLRRRKIYSDTFEGDKLRDQRIVTLLYSQHKERVAFEMRAPTPATLAYSRKRNLDEFM